VTGLESTVTAGPAVDATAPAVQRAEKMHLYLQFMSALDAGGARNSQAVSEVNMSDTEDIRAVITDGTSDVLVHFGDSDFLARYQALVAHRAEWLHQYPRLASVDMRYGRQVVLKMAPGDGTGDGVGATGQDATANLAGSNAAAPASAGKDTH
jgi:cell division protein FtsQ